MSIDFDSAALQTQQEEEEEYDPEDYIREQELHKLLTDLPDDMLDDSADCSSPELQRSTCSHTEDNRPQHTWNVPQWEHPGPSHEEHYEEYDQGSYHEDYSYRSHTSQLSSHAHRLQPGTEHLPNGWDPENAQNYQYNNGDYAHSSAGTDESHVTDFSTAEGAEQDGYTHNAQHGAGYHGDEGQGYGEQSNTRKPFQVFDNGGAGNKPADHYKATYHPHQPTNQAKMFNPPVTNQNGHFDQLQRDFLDSTQNSADGQQVAQLQILNRAQSRQIEELEQKLEDCRRRMRYLEHQFAIVKDEKDGLTVSLKESGALVEQAKEREDQLQTRTRALEKQIQSLTDREQEIVKQQRVAEAAMDSMKQQMMELCRSETLTRAREQHDRDTASIREQCEARLLTLQQKLDAQTQSLNEQTEAGQRLQEQLRQLERQRQEDQLDRAAVINTLTRRLEESQQQCAKLLHTGSVQEISQLQMKLQQAQSGRAISEDINKALQEELTELKEQINLYESAIKQGAMESNGDWENQISESYIDLGIKKSKWRTARMHSTPHVADAGVSKEDVVRELRSELQRCLAHLKSKRLKICELQEELRQSQSRAEQTQTQLEQAERAVRDLKVRESGLEKQLESSHMTVTPQEELIRLQERVEALEKKNQELKQSEDKLKAANSELCTKMREMIQELDQEKQEAAERNERTQQQYRDDVVNRVRDELTQEHTALIEQLTDQHQQHTQQLESKLAELRQEVLAVQECYISVCKEKDKLEENLQNKLEEEKKLKENEWKQWQESEAALRSDLECQHQQEVTRLRAQWRTEAQAELELQVRETLDTARQSWRTEQDTLEQSWALRLQEAEAALLKRDASEAACQTGCSDASGQLISPQELQNKHSDDITAQVEGAITRARSRWLQDLTSLPEFQSSLQTERKEWERLQQQDVQEQISSAVKAAEDGWRETLRAQRGELEESQRRNAELEEEMSRLRTQMEEETSRLKEQMEEETSRFRTQMEEETSRFRTQMEEETSCLREQLQREQKQKLQAVLQEKREQTAQKRDAELQETLQKKEQEWRSQEDGRLQEERRRVLEEVFHEMKDVLQEGRADPQELSVPGCIRSRVWEICRESLQQKQQEWMKISEDKLRRELEEAQEKGKSLLTHPSQSQSPVPSSAAAHGTQAKLQKKNQELQKHLEKACRQLQKSVREHRSSLQRMKEEHEAALQKEQQDHLRALEELKSSHAEALSRGSSSQQDLQAALEEMKEQYMKAVEKIRGDMLRYLQDSRQRAAELIRSEVQREQQDTARHMRRYYLSCLQELLEDGGQSAGAEKKIINAASKLAAMAKVLETPVSKRKPGRIQSTQGVSEKADIETSGSPAKVSLRDVKDRRLLQIYSLTDSRTSKPKAFEEESQKSAAVCGSKDSLTIGRVTQKHTHDTHEGVLDTDVRTLNVTLRKQSREIFTGGFESGRADCASVQPFLIEEAPVRDEGKSDWSLSSNGSHIPLTSFCPEPGKAFSVSGSSLAGLDFGRSIGENSDVTVYKEIIQPPSYSKPNIRTNKHREPVSGSVGHGVRKICPKSLFSELKVHQQDSGFDSPLALLQK